MITPKDSCFAMVQPRMGTSSRKLETWGAVRAWGGEGNVWGAVQGEQCLGAVQGGECLGCGAG